MCSKSLFEENNLETPTLLTRHAGMASLFKNVPDNWRVIDGGEPFDKMVSSQGSDIDILISAKPTPITADLMDRLPNLRLIALVAAGYSMVDLDAANARNIAVCNAPGLNANDVADIAATMTMSLLLELPQKHDFVLSGSWTKETTPQRHSIAGRKIGLVGMGAIGQAISKRLSPFGVDINWWGPRPKPEIPDTYESDLKKLAQWADALVVCCRSDQSTHHLINEAILSALGHEGILVNVARGDVVDEKALISALNEKRLAGAGLDVFDPEPTNAEIWQGVPNVLLSPHQGGESIEALHAQATLIQENISAFLKGKPLLTPVR